MEKQINQVAEFHKAFGHPIETEPTWPTPAREKLRMRLMQEELNETLQAIIEGDMTELGDGLCDLLYVIFGTALEFGLAHVLPVMFDEVHRSNMSKLGADGKPLFREDGKSLKGPNYSPPDLAQILINEINNRRR